MQLFIFLILSSSFTLGMRHLLNFGALGQSPRCATLAAALVEGIRKKQVLLGRLLHFEGGPAACPHPAVTSGHTDLASVVSNLCVSRTQGMCVCPMSLFQTAVTRQCKYTRGAHTFSAQIEQTSEAGTAGRRQGACFSTRIGGRGDPTQLRSGAHGCCPPVLPWLHGSHALLHHYVKMTLLHLRFTEYLTSHESIYLIH